MTQVNPDQGSRYQEVVEAYERATQEFTASKKPPSTQKVEKLYKMMKEVLDAGTSTADQKVTMGQRLRSMQESFVRATEKTILSQIKSQMKGVKGDSEKARLLHKTLEFTQSMLLSVGRQDEAVKLNKPIFDLTDEFGFKESEVDKIVKDVNKDFPLPPKVQVTAQKTATVAERIVPLAAASVVIMCQAVALHQEGKPIQEILVTTLAGIIAPHIAKPMRALIVNASPKALQPVVSVIVNTAVAVAVSRAVQLSMSATVRPLTQAASPASLEPMTPINATRPELPTCPMPEGPVQDLEPLPLGFANNAALFPQLEVCDSESVAIRTAKAALGAIRSAIDETLTNAAQHEGLGTMVTSIALFTFRKMTGR